MIKKRLISIKVDNEFGVLARIVGLFSARGYNIESLAVSEVDKISKISLITIETICSEQMAISLVKLLSRLVPVYEANDITNSAKSITTRTICLAKIYYEQSFLAHIEKEILECKNYNVEVTKLSCNEQYAVLQIVAENGDLVDNFLLKIKNFCTSVIHSKSGIVTA